MDFKQTPASCAEYQIEIPIRATREAVWHALFHEINAWWLPDFHMVGAGSTLESDASPGGRGLVESMENGAGLAWFQVQFYLPDQYKVYLVGNLAPDWGGPSTSNLKIELTESGAGCVLCLLDAHHGNIDSGNLQSLYDGWKQLMEDGLKEFVENGTRHDG